MSNQVPIVCIIDLKQIIFAKMLTITIFLTQLFLFCVSTILLKLKKSIDDLWLSKHSNLKVIKIR